METGMKLRQLPRGRRATIEFVQEHGGLSKRLADLGFIRGAEVTMVKPGRPCIVRIHGRSVGLGEAGQQQITLRASWPARVQEQA